MSTDAALDYDTLQKALDSALASLEPLKIERSRLEILPGPRFSGGYGVVVKATLDASSSSGCRIVAVKKLRMMEDENLRATVRLVRELKVWANLKHSNIVPLLGFHLAEDKGWLISPWAIHGNVQQFLSHNQVDMDTRSKIVLDVATGLAYLHRLSPAVCHGDLKPGNILIGSDKRGMLGDFGLSKAVEVDSTGLTTTKTIKGSVRYMAPELLLETEPHALASDVWAFGCVAFETLTGSFPFYAYQKEPQVMFQLTQGTPPALIHEQPMSGLSGEWLQVLQKCWSSTPKGRPSIGMVQQQLKIHLGLLRSNVIKGLSFLLRFDPQRVLEPSMKCLAIYTPDASVIFSYDGSYYSTIGSTSPAIVNLLTGRSWPVTKYFTSSASNAKDGRYFAFLTQKGVEVCYLTMDGSLERLSHLSNPNGGWNIIWLKISIAANGGKVAILDGYSGRVIMWNTSSGNVVTWMASTVGHILGLSLSPDGRYAAISRWGGPAPIEIHEAENGTVVTQIYVLDPKRNPAAWFSTQEKFCINNQSDHFSLFLAPLESPNEEKKYALSLRFGKSIWRNEFAFAEW